MAAQSPPASVKRDIVQERKFHRALEGSDQLLKVLGKHGRRYNVPAGEMESFGQQVSKICWEEAWNLLQNNGSAGALQAAQRESVRLRRQLSEATLSAVKQLGLRDAKDGAEAEPVAGDVQDLVTFYDPLGYVDDRTRELVLTIVCDKVQQIQRGTAPGSLVAAICEHIDSGRFEEHRKAACSARTAGMPTDVGSLQELLVDAESMARDAEENARESEEEASRALEQAQEAKLELKELKSEFTEATAKAEALEVERQESKAREGELAACCDELRKELEALQAALEEERRVGSELREEASQLREEVGELRRQSGGAAVEGSRGAIGDTGGPEDSAADGGSGGRGEALEEEAREEPLQPSGDTGGSGGGQPAGQPGSPGGAARGEGGAQTEERGAQTQVTGAVMEDQEKEIKRMRLLLEELQMKIKELAEQSRKQGIGDQVAELFEGIGLKEVLKKKTCFERLYEDAQKRVERLELLREKVRRERRALLNGPAVEEDIDIKIEPSVLATIEQSRLPGLRRMLRADEAVWPGGNASPVLSKAAPKEASHIPHVRSCCAISPTASEASPSNALPPPALSPPPPRPAMAGRPRQQGEPWPPVRGGGASPPPPPGRFRVPGRRQLLRESSLPAIPRRPMPMESAGVLIA